MAAALTVTDARCAAFWGASVCGFYPRILHVTYEHEKCLCRNGRRFVQNS
jgi:hypothetical protein